MPTQYFPCSTYHVQCIIFLFVGNRIGALQTVDLNVISGGSSDSQKKRTDLTGNQKVHYTCYCNSIDKQRLVMIIVVKENSNNNNNNNNKVLNRVCLTNPV